jgi:hypothetical protein
LEKEDGYTEEGPLLEGRRQEAVWQAEHLLREPPQGKTLQEEALQQGAPHIP